MKSLKKFFLTIVLASFCSLNCFTQGALPFKTQSKLINRLPAETGGYLVLNTYDFPSVVRWEINFLYPDFNSSGELITLTPERTVELEGTYYTNQVEISAGADHHGFMEIVGYNNTGNVVVSDGPVVYPLRRM